MPILARFKNGWLFTFRYNGTGSSMKGIEIGVQRIKADSHIPFRSPAMPFC
jgi:hypothetical protein